MLVQIDLLNDCHDTVGIGEKIGGEDCGGDKVIIGWICHQLICEFLDKFRIKAKYFGKKYYLCGINKNKVKYYENSLH